MTSDMALEVAHCHINKLITPNNSYISATAIGLLILIITDCTIELGFDTRQMEMIPLTNVIYGFRIQMLPIIDVIYE